MSGTYYIERTSKKYKEVAHSVIFHETEIVVPDINRCGSTTMYRRSVQNYIDSISIPRRHKNYDTDDKNTCRMKIQIDHTLAGHFKGLDDGCEDYIWDKQSY